METTIPPYPMKVGHPKSQPAIVTRACQQVTCDDVSAIPSTMPRPASTPTANPIGLALVSVIAIAISWHLSPWFLALVVPVVAWVFGQVLTDQWWRERSRAFGRQLESRALSDLKRISTVLRIPIETNVPVAGSGDADAILGTRPVIVEVKSFRSWDSGAQRCIDAIAQVERLKDRLGIERAIIWLPQGHLTLTQRLGFVTALPRGTRIVVGPAWRPAIRCFTFTRPVPLSPGN